jgi:hypothetical protein
MDIKTIGDFRRLTQNLDDDFKLDVRIMKEVTEEELKNRRYPYPWDMFDGRLEFHDIGYSDKEFCIGVYEQ